MKKTQNNTQLGNSKDFLPLKNCDVYCININQGSEDPPVFSIKIDSDILENLICIDLEDFVRMNKFFENALKDTAKIPEYFLRLKDCIIRLEKTYKDSTPVFLLKIKGVLMKNSTCFDLEDFEKMNRFLTEAEKQTKQ